MASADWNRPSAALVPRGQLVDVQSANGGGLLAYDRLTALVPILSIPVQLPLSEIYRDVF